MPRPHPIPDFLKEVDITSSAILTELLGDFYEPSTAGVYAVQYLRGEAWPGVVKVVRDEITVRGRHKGIPEERIASMTEEAINYGQRAIGEENKPKNRNTPKTKTLSDDEFFATNGGEPAPVISPPVPSVTMQTPPTQPKVAIRPEWLERTLESSSYLKNRPDLCIIMKEAGLDNFGVIIEKLIALKMGLESALVITERFFAGEVLKRQTNGEISSGSRFIASLCGQDPMKMFARDIELYFEAIRKRSTLRRVSRPGFG